MMELMAPLPHALDKNFPLFVQIPKKKPVIFLDFDGTLTPIVDHPDQVVLSQEILETLRKLAKKTTVAILSGRPRREMEAILPIPGLYFGGSHGIDLKGPAVEKVPKEVLPMLPAVQEAVSFFEAEMNQFPHAWVEDKKYTVAIHYRTMDPELIPPLKKRVEHFAKSHPQLKFTSGKKIFELRPNIPWDKGVAVLYLLKSLQMEGPNILPIFVGDDQTDEDAFRVLKNRGWGILVDPMPGTTSARAYLKSPDEVGLFLGQLVMALGTV